MHFSHVAGVLALSLLTAVPYNAVQGFDLQSLRGRFVGNGASFAAAHMSAVEGALKKRDTIYERDLPILGARHDKAAKASNAKGKGKGKKKGAAAASSSTVAVAAAASSSPAAAANPSAGSVTTLNGGGNAVAAAVVSSSAVAAAPAASSSATTTSNNNGKHKGKANQNANSNANAQQRQGNAAGGNVLASLIGNLEGGLRLRDALPVAALPV